MNRADVTQRLDRIREIQKDVESAHYEEDAMRRELLQSIADGTCSDPAGCAALALTSQEIRFARWYA